MVINVRVKLCSGSLSCLSRWTAWFMESIL